MTTGDESSSSRQRDVDVGLSLDQALRRLRQGKEPFTPADRVTINEVLNATGTPTRFIPRDAYVWDYPEEQVHIHPTMIVSRFQVPGAIRTNTYRRFPWQVELTKWTARTNHPRNARGHIALCQVCFNPIDERHAAAGCY